VNNPAHQQNARTDMRILRQETEKGNSEKKMGIGDTPESIV
jgi:hypothetical protein